MLFIKMHAVVDTFFKIKILNVTKLMIFKQQKFLQTYTFSLKKIFYE